MKQGQFYGTIGQVGYGPIMMEIYNQEAERLRRLGIAEEEQKAKLLQYAMKYETESNKFLKLALEQRQKAIKEGKPSAGVLSQYFMAQVKTQSIIAQIEKAAKKRGTDVAEAEADAIAAVEDLFNYDSYPSSGKTSSLIYRGLLGVNEATSQENVAASIGTILDAAANELRQIAEGDVDEKAVVIAGIRDQLMSALASKGFDPKTFEAGINYKINQLSGVNPADFTPEYLAERKAIKLGQLPDYGTSTSEAIDTLKDLYDDIEDARKDLGGDSKTIKKAERLFYKNPALKDYFRALEVTDFNVSPQMLEEIAEKNNTTVEKIAEDFNEAKKFNDENPALVPEEFVPFVTTSVLRQRQKAAQTRSQLDAFDRQEAPDLERIAAQRYLATTPRPMRMYTKEQRKDIRKGIYVPEVGSKIQQTDRSIQANLRDSENYRNWYNSLTKGEQVMQRYGTTAGALFDDMQSDPSFTPKGRAQKFATQLFEASQNQMLTADELVQQTAEGLRSKEDQDEARAYYAALFMNKNASTEAPVETQDVQQEAAVQQAVETPQTEVQPPEEKPRLLDRLFRSRVEPPAAQPVQSPPKPLESSQFDALLNQQQFFGPLDQLAGNTVIENPLTASQFENLEYGDLGMDQNNVMSDFATRQFARRLARNRGN